MIHFYSNETQTRWDKGEFKVQLLVQGNSRPMGFCDGTQEDIDELSAIAEAEGADEAQINKKRLKTGREIWTLGAPS